MKWQEHITADPAVLVGKPVIKGTRLSVEFILELIAEGWSEADMLRNYPGLTREQILACVAHARDRLSEERVSVSGTFALTTPGQGATVFP